MTWMVISRRRPVEHVLKTFTVVLSPRVTAASPGQAQHGSCHKGSACKFLICGSSRGGAVPAVRNWTDILAGGRQSLHDQASPVGGAQAAVTADQPSS